jgi:hypothetical protein
MLNIVQVRLMNQLGVLKGIQPHLLLTIRDFLTIGVTFKVYCIFLERVNINRKIPDKKGK